MGRFPFIEEHRSYIMGVRGFYSEGTLTRITRNLNTIHRDLQCLREQGEHGNISTTNPAKLTERDISELLHLWRTRLTRSGKPMLPSTQAKYLSDLEGLLNWHSNGVIEQMRLKKFNLPVAVTGPIEVKNVSEIDALRAAAERIPGWKGSTARLLVALILGSGMRRKEFRLARRQNTDIERWRVLVSNPKGEGAWASEDYAPILPSARQPLLDFLEERKAFLKECGQDHEALVPYRRRDGQLDFWSDAMIGKLKGEIQRLSGVTFKLCAGNHNLRATFGQSLRDKGVGIESVSKAMRHRTTKTTETYYTRIRTDRAFQEIEEAFLVQN